MKYNDLFFALLREALWRCEDCLPSELSDKQAYTILRMAEQQAVSGLVTDALIRHDIKLPQALVFESVALQSQIQQANLYINKGLKRLVGLFNERHIDYAVVKGQTVAVHYPDPSLRQSGDIDYYCDKENFPKSQQAIKEAWGIEADAHDSEHHVHYDYKGVTYEGHFALTSLYSSQKTNYWQRLLDNEKGSEVTIDGKAVKTLSPTLHTLFVFLHLYSHLLELGIGLRQFCDLAMMLHACRNEIDHQLMKEHLKAFGITKAYKACGSILVDYLGLPANDLFFSLNETDRRYGKKILDVVFYRGNMGHYNKRNGFHGWKHNIEATGIKLSHFLKFMSLTPGYSCRWLAYEIGRKTLLKLKYYILCLKGKEFIYAWLT